jgi:hypothetical protein
MFHIMVKRLVLLTTVCFVAIFIMEGCKGKKEEGVQENKSAEPGIETNEKKTLPDEEGLSSKTSKTPPKVTGARILPDPAYTATDLRVEVESEDADNDTIKYDYEWVKAKKEDPLEDGKIIEGEYGPTLSHEKFVKGEVVLVKISPYDLHGEGKQYQTESVLIANSPPKIVSHAPESVSDENLYAYQVEVCDPDGDPIIFSLGEGAPEGMNIDSSTGLITWSIPPQTVGSYTIDIHADDTHQGSCFQRFTLTLESHPMVPEETQGKP